ncbi:MAG: hypothetical protein RL033_6552 [Pseudomonadota bacterium]
MSATRAALGRLLGFALDSFALGRLLGFALGRLLGFAREGFADVAAEGRVGLLGLDGWTAAAERATEVLRFTAMDDS